MPSHATWQYLIDTWPWQLLAFAVPGWCVFTIVFALITGGLPEPSKPRPRVEPLTTEKIREWMLYHESHQGARGVPVPKHRVRARARGKR